jgi:hypothetical protein
MRRRTSGKVLKLARGVKGNALFSESPAPSNESRLAVRIGGPVGERDAPASGIQPGFRLLDMLREVCYLPV